MNLKDKLKISFMSRIVIKDKDTNEILMKKSDNNQEGKKNDQ